MECHPWFEVSDRRKIRFRNVQIKVLLVFEQGRPLQVSPVLTILTSFDQFQPVLTSFDQVLTSLDWFLCLLITSKIQYFWGGSLLLPTSVIFGTHEKFRICFRDYLTFKKQSRKNREEMLHKKSFQLVLISTHIGVFLLPNT